MTTVLDSSAIIDMLAGVEPVVEAVEARDPPYLTSTLCVYEVLEGRLGGGQTELSAVRADFDGVRAVDLTEDVVRAAARLQDDCIAAGERLPTRDVLVAGTARSVDAPLVVTDGDFQRGPLTDEVAIHDPRT